MDLKQPGAYEDNRNGSSGKFTALTFAAGGLLGAAMGVLLTPWKGTQTREKIKEVAGDLKEKTRGLGWREKTRRWLKKGEDPAEKRTGTVGSETGTEGGGNTLEGELVQSSESMPGGVTGS